jgi:uncharacterized protein YukE
MSTTQMWAGEGSLGRAATMVAAGRADFDRLAGALTERITAEQGRWQGAGGRSFFALQLAWAERQQTVVAALTRFEQTLLETQAAHAAVDADAAAAQRAGHDRLQGVSR